MNDVFSREKGNDGETGRIAKVGKVRQELRLRSLLLWVGVHWVDGPGLCSGSQCELCKAGVSKRRKAWVAVDRANGSFASWELSESDVANFMRSCAANGVELSVGLTLSVRRSGDRTPLTVDGVRFFPGLGEISQDVLMSDVLKFHGITANMAEIRGGEYRRLVAMRAAELARSRCGALS